MANVPAIDVEKAKEILNSLTSQAQELLKNTSKLEKVLQQMEDKLKEIPKVGDALSRVPLMISMIRSYVTKEYSVVSPKVIITLIAAIIYMVKDQDLIPDSTPVLGHVDDLARPGHPGRRLHGHRPRAERLLPVERGKRKSLIVSEPKQCRHPRWDGGISMSDSLLLIPGILY